MIGFTEVLIILFFVLWCVGFSFFHFGSSRETVLLIFFISKDGGWRIHCNKHTLLHYFSYPFLVLSFLFKNRTKSPYFSRCPSVHYILIFRQEGYFMSESVLNRSLKKTILTQILLIILKIYLLLKTKVQNAKL